MTPVDQNIQSDKDNVSFPKLDYSLQTSEERKNFVKNILADFPEKKMTAQYLSILSDYIIFPQSKKEKKENSILTPNRITTINKRETSFEGLCSKLENGEDGIYNMQSDLGKQAILTIKDPITKKELEEIPELRELKKAIEEVEEQFSRAIGKRRYQLKKQIIEMRQDQYVIRNEYRGNFGYGGHHNNNNTAKTLSSLDLDDKIYLDENKLPHNDGLISLFEPKHIEALLCNYADLKQASEGNFDNDLWFLMEDLDELIEKTLKHHNPLYYDLLIYKIDGRTNLEIQKILQQKYNIKHTIEYISVLWRKKIPKALAEQAQKDYLIWHYTFKEKGEWKKCSRCGQIKLVHNTFFSKNKTSKDGFYSLCKECRNKK